MSHKWGTVMSYYCKNTLWRGKWRSWKSHNTTTSKTYVATEIAVPLTFFLMSFAVSADIITGTTICLTLGGFYKVKKRNQHVFWTIFTYLGSGWGSTESKRPKRHISDPWRAHRLSWSDVKVQQCHCDVFKILRWRFYPVRDVTELVFQRKLEKQTTGWWNVMCVRRSVDTEE